jgi:hypothetical protein
MESFKSSDPVGILGGYAPLRDERLADTPSEKETAFISSVKERLDQSRAYINELCRSWDYVRLFIEGYQYITRDSVTQEYLPVLVDEDVRRRYSADNIMHEGNRAFVGKVTRIIPFVTAVPRSADREDIASAERIDSYLDFMFRKERMKVKYKRGNDFLGWAGTAIYQPVWDTQAGRERALCPSPKCGYQGEVSEVGQPCPMCQEEANQVVMAQAAVPGPQFADQSPQEPPEVPTLVRGNEGDQKILLHDPRSFLYDSSATEVEDMLWAGTERTLSVQRIRRMFPHAAHLIQSEGNLRKERYVIYNGSLANSRVETRFLKEHANLVELHEMPTSEWPDGSISFICNDRLLEQRPNIYVKLLRRLPFYPIRADRRADRFHGEPLGYQAEPLQRERNKLVTQMREHRELTLAPKVRADYDSGLNMKFLSTEPGEVIKQYKMSRPWDYVRGPEMPAYVPQEAERLKYAILSKFGITPGEVGDTKSGQSGRLTIAIEAQSSEAVAPILIENYDEWRELARAQVVIGEHFMGPERTWTTLGQDRMPQTYSWGNVLPGWDVALVEEDALSRTPALRQEQARQYLADGVFTDPNTGRPNMRLYMRVAGLVLPNSGPDKEGIDRAYALKLPQLVEEALDGGAPPPQPKMWDNARVMADELEGWLKAHRLDPQTRQDVFQLVEQMWVFYATSIAPMGPDDAGLMPNQAIAQRTAGTPQPQRVSGPSGPQQQPAGNEVDQRVAQVDQAGEQLARGNQPHEG